MKMDTSDLQPVTFQKEREQVLAELSTKSVLLTVLNSKGESFALQFDRVHNGYVYANAPGGATSVHVSAQEKVSLIFGLNEGKYILHTAVAHVQGAAVAIGFAGELFRIQRRRHFRAPVPLPPGRFQLLVELTSEKPPRQLEAMATNLSAGGTRVRWPKGLAVPKVGESVRSIFKIRQGRDLVIDCLVRNIFVEADDQTSIGLEFQSLNGRDEQMLIALCLQLRRDARPLG